METLPPKKAERRPFRVVRRLFQLILFLAIVAGAGYYGMNVYYPNKEHVSPDYGAIQKPIFYKGQLLENGAAGEREGLKLPLPFLQQSVDATIRYEDASKSVIVTTKDKVVRMKTDQLTATVNERPMQLPFPIENKDGVIYMPIEPLRPYYGLDIRESAETGNVVVHIEGDTIQWGKASDKPRSVALRQQPSIKAPIIADLHPGEEVMIWKEQDGWYTIQQQNGTTGYARKKDIVLDRIETIPSLQRAPAMIPWKPLGGKINMTWEQVTSRNPDTTKIDPMPGLNVISPTWFSIADGNGTLKNIADASYVQWAHDQQLQVWALFSNGFDPDLTNTALATYDTRSKMIKQLLAFAEMYNLDGINIDFEDVYLKDKDNLTQFVREMTPLMHEQGLVVSMDVTVKSTSENWSMFYDRAALIQVIDYMMVMAYDEHWASSPVAGSVASLPWVEKSVLRMTEEDNIPHHKLVLGVPFYTRIWTEETKNGKTEVSSRAVFMDTANKLIEEKKLKKTFSPEAGQNYVEYTEGGKRYRIWLEDDVSMKARMDLIKKHNFAGVASWRRGYETPDIWDLIKRELEARP